MENNDIREIRKRVYDNPDGNPESELIGRFRVIQQLEKDMYEELFLGVNIETGELTLVVGNEVCGYGGGIVYSAYVLNIESAIEQRRQEI